jgi:hypothetical protein
VDGTQEQRLENMEGLQSIRETLMLLVQENRELKEMLQVLLKQRAVKEWYSTAEVAELLGKAEFTVREWCRNRRIKAQKRKSGRGAFPSWTIAREEVLRIEREGLLPLRGYE